MCQTARVNKYRLALAENTGILNGVIFNQGLYRDENGAFYIFESGCRSAAEAPYRIIEKVSGKNYMKLLMENPLTEKICGASRNNSSAPHEET